MKTSFAKRVDYRIYYIYYYNLKICQIDDFQLQF